MPTPERIKKYTNTKHGRFKELLKGAKKSAGDRNQEFSITYDYLKEQWENQQGLCLYTGWEMTTKTNDLTLVSIERKDNQKGYIPGNVVLVCWCVNRARARMSIKDFVSMCEAVSKTYDKQQEK
jgi:hypothetical protein